eukprot:TRINITY_DN224_c1_g1_i4.p1 TRINITY_DN224_c1_g1~~TRINITY_DN224_c1_g1_i4.p1  ORF type:complete len:263 (+),score=46.44 TRINITY_DN224_c1_g1_i4:17-805(+)
MVNTVLYSQNQVLISNPTNTSFLTNNQSKNTFLKMGNEHSLPAEFGTTEYLELLLSNPKKALQICRLNMIALPKDQATTLKVGKTNLNDVKMGRMAVDMEDVQDLKVLNLSTLKNNQVPVSAPYTAVPGYILATPKSAEDAHVMVTAPFVGGCFVMKLVDVEGEEEKSPKVAHIQAGGSRGTGTDLRFALSRKEAGFEGVKESRFDTEFGDHVEYKLEDIESQHIIVVGVFIQGSWQFWSQQSIKKEDGSFKVKKVDLLYKK